ncbi:ParB/Srx family N-terminal domain-containing protein [Sphingomonas sp.]|uniref:ParB/Srx family N-terminal domain-containing protein n=1 Tax=Sphingomonas sp. TaxID=28214 RepID=UPI003CC55643
MYKRHVERSLALTVRSRKLDELHPYANNAKLHKPEQIRALAKGIAAHGFINPILADKAGEIIAGHARYEAAKSLGLTEVPVIELGHLSEAQKRAYRIADNRLAEVGTSWSMDLLRVEVDAILELDASSDISLTGFEAPELALSFRYPRQQARSRRTAGSRGSAVGGHAPRRHLAVGRAPGDLRRCDAR